MAVLRPAHPPSASRGCPYAVPLAMAASGTPAARPHACVPVSRCTTVPSRSPPQRLQRCKSFSAALIASSTALIAFDSAPRAVPPEPPQPRRQPVTQHQPAGPAAAVQRPALTAQGWRGWGSPRWRQRVCQGKSGFIFPILCTLARVCTGHSLRQCALSHCLYQSPQRLRVCQSVYNRHLMRLYQSLTPQCFHSSALKRLCVCQRVATVP